MTDIYARRRHGRSQEEAREAAENLVQRLARDYGLAYRWQGNELRFARSGVNGHVEVGPSEVVVEATLGLMLKPLRGRIQQRVDEYLDQRLA
jgi:putative polyhydroxyalkanoate system protein